MFPESNSNQGDQTKDYSDEPPYPEGKKGEASYSSFQETSRSKKSGLLRKIRWLKQALILSACLNGLFVAIFFYFLVRENPYPLTFEYPPAQRSITPVLIPAEMIHSYASLSFDVLRNHLSDDRLLKDGYRACDFALAVLVYRDHIDIKRALGKKSLSERAWKVSDKHTLKLFPGLQKDDFARIESFLQTERWPQTAEGLFLTIKKMGIKEDVTLVQRFCQTSEFQSVELLFSHAQVPIKRGTLVTLCSQGSWATLETFYQNEKESANFSASCRQNLLVHYLKEQSTAAAYLLLLTDYAFVAEQFDNDQVISLLRLLTVKTPQAIRFAKDMALSLRSDEVKKQAADCLLRFGCESDTLSQAKIPEKILAAKPPGTLLETKQLRPAFRDPPPASPSPRVHVIASGESLWIIAKKYKVSIDEIMAINHLSSSTIQPGKTLKIPLP